MCLFASCRITSSFFATRPDATIEIYHSHDTNAAESQKDHHGNQNRHDYWEPHRHGLPRGPRMVVRKICVERLQTDLHRVEHDGADCEDGKQGSQAVGEEGAPLRVNVEEGQLSLKESCSHVEPTEAQFAVVVPLGDLDVVDFGKGLDEVAPLFICGKLPVGLLGDQHLLTCQRKVDLVLDQEVVAPHEAEASSINIQVGVGNVLPEGGAVEVGRDGFDVDSLVVPDQMKTGMLVDLDLSVVCVLMVERHNVKERWSLDLVSLSIPNSARAAQDDSGKTYKDILHILEHTIQLRGQVVLIQI